MTVTINTASLLFDVAQIADAYGDIDAQIKQLEKRKEELRKALIATGKELVEGATFSIGIDISERRTVKVDDVVKTFGADAAAAIINTSDVYTLRAKKR